MSEEQPADAQPAEAQPVAEGEAKPEGQEESAIALRIKKDPYEMSFLTPLPEKIEFNAIPKINDARSVWRVGMRKLEETFAEHIANMHLDFEAKAVKYEQIQFQLETNHRFLDKYYLDMQALLNEKYASIKIERDQWEHEKEEIRKLVKIESEIVNLNVGGTHHIATEKDVLRSVPGSTLAKYFSDMHELKKIGEEVFLDRDGKTFETLVNYLRNERKVFPEFTEKNMENHFYKELHFWGIDQHNRHIQEQILRSLDKSQWVDNQDRSILKSPRPSSRSFKKASPQQYKEEEPDQIMSQNQSYMGGYDAKSNRSTPISDDDDQPGAALRAVKEKWTELGPLKLEDIIQNSQVPIDQSLQFGQSKYNRFIIGQIGPDGRVQGVGKEINHIIYEGQFLNDIYHGYGRYIYSNGNYYLGNWQDGKRSGWGKLVDKSGKIYEGMWQHSKYMGN